MIAETLGYRVVEEYKGLRASSTFPAEVPLVALQLIEVGHICVQKSAGAREVVEAKERLIVCP